MNQIEEIEKVIGPVKTLRNALDEIQTQAYYIDIKLRDYVFKKGNLDSDLLSLIVETHVLWLSFDNLNDCLFEKEINLRELKKKVTQ